MSRMSTVSATPSDAGVFSDYEPGIAFDEMVDALWDMQASGRSGKENSTDKEISLLLRMPPFVLRRFVREVDASLVAANASTRFNDGFQLGLGMVTIITTAAVYLTWATALLSASTAAGLVVGVAFGLARALPIFGGLRVTGPDQLAARVTERQRPPGEAIIDQPPPSGAFRQPAKMIVRAVLVARLLVLLEAVRQPGQAPQRELQPIGQFLRRLKLRQAKVFEPCGVGIPCQIEPIPAGGAMGANGSFPAGDTTSCGFPLPPSPAAAQSSKSSLLSTAATAASVTAARFGAAPSCPFSAALFF